ncbi:hypothetical protein ADL12_41620 [Streptomyces regalis]|uniref:Amidase domain-containing protein n=1 Tax=Streptomyces regalis TaxID=68262 RepID=A0A101J9K0_9ACTN|nr:hypothetical protein ADL12_41620 [Streptomyces regalis]
MPVPDYTAGMGEGIEGLQLGYARDLFADVPGVSPEVVELMDASAQQLAALGAVVEEVKLPDFELFKACGRLIMTAEAYAIHEDALRERPYDFGRYTYQRIVGAATLSAADLIQAFRLRQELTVALNRELLGRYDALFTTVALAPPAHFDEFPLDWPPPSLTVAVQTVPFNVTGNPALVVPAGFSASGLPFGLQIVGRAFDEAGVLRIGAAIDAILSVTEGRGGTFADSPDPADPLRLAYTPSGHEPAVIVPMSPSGMFTHSRAENRKAEDSSGVGHGSLEHEPIFLTHDAVRTLRRRVGRRAVLPTGETRQLDFGTQVFPLVVQEMAHVYQRVQLGHDFAAEAKRATLPAYRAFLLNPPSNRDMASPCCRHPWSGVSTPGSSKAGPGRSSASRGSSTSNRSGRKPSTTARRGQRP